MAGKVLLLSILISVCCSCKASTIREILKLPEPDEELLGYLKAASSRAKFNFSQGLLETNFHSLHDEEDESQYLKFDDTFMKIGDDDIYLMNMKIVGKLSIQLTHAEPDLISNFMDTELSWNDVKVEGDFEFYQNSHHETPELINGTFSMIWKNVKAIGSIGFLPFEHTDGFYSTAHDLKFTSDGFDLKLNTEEDGSHESHNLYEAEDRFKEHFQDDLFWKLQESLRPNIDDYLQTKSTLQIFGNNVNVKQRYVKYAHKTTVVINDLVDDVLEMVKAGIAESGFWKFSIPSINEGFSKKIWFVTFKGYFSAWNGYAEDLKTIRRKGDFAVIMRNETMEVTGSLEVQYLSAKYNNYAAKFLDMGPTGTISANVGTNALAFKIEIVPDGKSIVGFRIKDYSFKVHVGNIKVNVTGLWILNWLLSYIVSWVVNSWKGEITHHIEKEASQVIDKIIKSFWP
ncbi:unnamed protein product [Hermetia illucens]|uniref:Uncharacterized protein n=1 Tax=Hermetia illucens TaxID=343691 RepID=A0A7R8UZ77_HERIL|nr:uncharacterized protein LOC119658322 [Hermetia illucens]CAD7089727.1 unnamed protein product [Hermetia illucens]